MSISSKLAAKADHFSTLIGNARFTDAKKKALDKETGMRSAVEHLDKVRRARGSVYLVGNGGSSALVSHVLTDFVNVCGLKASTLHEPALLTCLSNDFGYESAFERALLVHARAGDLLVAVSSSGRSPNIHRAADAMRRLGGTVLTLTGFDAGNALRSKGDWNVWLDSKNYGLVEVGHLFILHDLADRLGPLKNGKK